MADHVLTHHVNIRNPKGDVQTFEPGADLPKWASDVLLAENHVAYPQLVDVGEDELVPAGTMRRRDAERAVQRWQASKAAAEAEGVDPSQGVRQAEAPSPRQANAPDVIENRILDYLTKGTAPAALTAPIRVRLLSALGTADAAGTPITGGTTPTRDYGAVANTQVSEGAQTSNGVVLRYEGLPNPTTVAGMQLLDSTATPIITVDNIARTGGSVSVVDGIFEVAAGGLTTNAK